MPKEQLQGLNTPCSPVSSEFPVAVVLKDQPSLTVDYETFSREYSEKWKPDTGESRVQHKRSSLFMKNYQSKVSESRTKKRKQDPDAPKKALSAFFLFCQDERPKVRSEHPEWKVGEIAKELGKRWEHCKNKSKYESQAQVEKQRYEKAMAKYKAGKKAKAD
ncbi:High mobility group protein DSP1 [Fasciola hepatica]|uniref:High mobility group protein DSP1 n=1 Tax=Fasciola hepatica TaxID=6192 RepID=A0A4E0S3J7_FASHE|nr:High mobility group protein DSP1 [Fasciola hepatica]